MTTEEVDEELKPTLTLKAFVRPVNFSVSFYALKGPQDTREKDQGLPKVVIRGYSHYARISKNSTLNARVNQK